MSEVKKFPTRLLFAGVLTKLRLVAINPSFEWLESHGQFLSEPEKAAKHRDYSEIKERSAKEGEEPVQYTQCKYDLYFQAMPGSNAIALAKPHLPADEQNNPILIRKSLYLNNLFFNKKDTGEKIIFTLDETGGSYDKEANSFYKPGAEGTYEALNGEADLIKFIKTSLGLRAADHFSLRKDGAGKDIHKASDMILNGTINLKAIVQKAVEVNAFTYISKKGYQALDTVRNYNFFESKPKEGQKSDFAQIFARIKKAEKIADGVVGQGEVSMKEMEPGKIFLRGTAVSQAMCFPVSFTSSRTVEEYEDELGSFFGSSTGSSSEFAPYVAPEDENLPF